MHSRAGATGGARGHRPRSCRSGGRRGGRRRSRRARAVRARPTGTSDRSACPTASARGASSGRARGRSGCRDWTAGARRRAAQAPPRVDPRARATTRSPTPFGAGCRSSPSWWSMPASRHIRRAPPRWPRSPRLPSRRAIGVCSSPAKRRRPVAGVAALVISDQLRAAPRTVTAGFGGETLDLGGVTRERSTTSGRGRRRDRRCAPGRRESRRAVTPGSIRTTRSTSTRADLRSSRPKRCGRSRWRRASPIRSLEPRRSAPPWFCRLREDGRRDGTRALDP